MDGWTEFGSFSSAHTHRATVGHRRSTASPNFLLSTAELFRFPPHRSEFTVRKCRFSVNFAVILRFFHHHLLVHLPRLAELCFRHRGRHGKILRGQMVVLGLWLMEVWGSAQIIGDPWPLGPLAFCGAPMVFVRLVILSVILSFCEQDNSRSR